MKKKTVSDKIFMEGLRDVICVIYIYIKIIFIQIITVLFLVVLYDGFLYFNFEKSGSETIPFTVHIKRHEK